MTSRSGAWTETVQRAHDELTSPYLVRLIDQAQQREPVAIRRLYRALGERGLLCPHWSPTYGGEGCGPATATAIYEELVHAGVPDTPYVLTVQIVGEILSNFAGEKTKYFRLPKISSGEALASVLYTEPGAGSDLGALAATATPCGEGYRLTGTKVYSLYSDVADFAIVAARVGDMPSNRYAGITLFVVDLDSDMISIETLPSVQDERFCKVRLRDVLVGQSAVVGHEGQGWELLERALAIERTGIDHAARAFSWLKPLVSVLEAAPAQDDRLSRLGRLAQRTDVALSLSRAVAQDAGRSSAAVVATAKCVASEVARDVAIETFVSLGSQAGDALSNADSAAREAPGLTLSAGTSEMMHEMFLAALHEDDVGVLDPGSNTLDRATFDATSACIASVLREGRRPSPDARSDAGRAHRLWTALAEAQLPLLELAPALGGFGLGVGAGVTICESLGAESVEDPYTTGLSVLEELDADDPRTAGLVAGRDLATWSDRCVEGKPVPIGVLRPGRAPVPQSSGDQAAIELTADAASRARLRHTAYVLAMSLAAVRETWQHARGRRQFGAALNEHQAVTHPLAAIAMELTALRDYLHQLAELDAGDWATRSTAVLGLHSLALEQSVQALLTCVQTVGTRALTGSSSVGARYARVVEEARSWSMLGAVWRVVGRSVLENRQEAYEWLR